MERTLGMAIRLASGILRKKKMQLMLLGLILGLCASLLCVAFQLMVQDTKFEVMFERANSAHTLLMFSGLEEPTGVAKRTLEEGRRTLMAMDTVASIFENPVYYTKVETKGEKTTSVALTPFLDQDKVGGNWLYTSERERAVAPKMDEVVVNTNFARNNRIALGDEIKWGQEVLRVSAIVVDPQFSNAFISNGRVYVAPNFFKDHNLEFNGSYMGVRYKDFSRANERGAIEGVKAAAETLKGGSFMYILEYEMLEASYTRMFGIIALTLLFAAVLMLFLVVVVIKNTMAHVLLLEYRGLGVKKVLGFTQGMISLSYQLAYGVVALGSSVLGLVPGLYFSQKLFERSRADLLVSASSLGSVASGVAVVLLAPLCVVILVWISTFWATFSVRHIKPVQAIKYGAPPQKTSGSRFKIHKFKRLPFAWGPLQVPTVVLLAIKQLLMHKGKSLATLVMVTVMIYTALVIQSAGQTLQNEAHFLKNILGLEGGEVTIVDSNSRVRDTLLALEDLGGVEAASFNTITQQQFVTGVGGEEIGTGGVLIYGTVPKDLIKLTAGRAPLDGSEVVMSALLAEEAGKGLGEIIELREGDQTFRYLICGLFDTISYNNRAYVRLMGKPSVADAKAMDLSGVAARGDYRLYFSDENVMMEEIDKKVKAVLSEDARVTRFDQNSSVILSTLEPFGPLIFTLLVAFVGVCGVMMFNWTMMDLDGATRTFGILKALGMTHHQMRAVMVLRSMMMVGAGLVLGSVLNWVTAGPLMNGIFSVSPFSTIKLPILFDGVGAMGLGLAIIAAALVGTWWPSLRLKRVSAKCLIVE